MTIEPMHLILAGAVLVILWTLIHAHRSVKNDFDLFDLLKQNGRASKVSVIIMGAFSVSTWTVVNREMHGTLTSDFFGLYLTAWVAPLITLLATGNGKKEEAK